ncbi:hypothetical protein OTB20_23210 [Streptomyces sp. H27-H1]|uniref:hypothetical protein n=1 Tax=Streptomyces sp. H27-H1 TaxID=2996461 RepID=UPI00226ED132|nr:hypothetical protein [Streptomyces sp. H27-H1]MCY0929056.1 hypothetical protein [Streptomyces sp. H27-H1]
MTGPAALPDGSEALGALRSKVGEYLLSHRSSLLSSAVSDAGHVVQVVTVVVPRSLPAMAAECARSSAGR